MHITLSKKEVEAAGSGAIPGRNSGRRHSPADVLGFLVRV